MKYKGKYRDISNTFFVSSTVVGNEYVYCKKGVLEWVDHNYNFCIIKGIYVFWNTIKFINEDGMSQENELGRFDDFNTITKEEFITGYNEYINKFKEIFRKME